MGTSAQARRGVAFIQRRAHKAGAQTCLARLLRHPTVKEWNPVVICAETGWLTDECARLGVATLQMRFPPSRTVAARMIQNGLFARKVARRLRATGRVPAVVHANDHGEALLALSVAKQIGAKTALFFRSSGMTKRDYIKYGCERIDFTAVVGPKLGETIKSWGVRNPPVALYDGIYPEEVLVPKAKTKEFPRQWLVIGGPHPAKGWSDLIEALYRLQSQGRVLPPEIDFTGSEPTAEVNDLRMGRLKNVRARFLGRVENFMEIVRRYDLVINPSRSETSGMAALEVIAAGVPLLTSRAGIIEYYQVCPQLSFEAGDVGGMAAAIRWLAENWRTFDPMIAASQQKVLCDLNIHDSVKTLVGAYRQLVGHD